MYKISKERYYVVSHISNTVRTGSNLALTCWAVSQFTLLASTKKGSKPDFHGAAGGENARELYDRFFDKVKELYEPEKVKNGVFQAMMQGTCPPPIFRIRY